MEWLNYHHLLYFFTVAREGGVARAATKLRLSHPTISGQVAALEEALGEKLFERRGRNLVLTEMGKIVYGYAEEIFSLGGELLDTVKGRPSGRPIRLVVGISEVMPKLIVRQLLQPARDMREQVYIVCREDKTERLLAELATHSVDVVLSDSPVPPGSPIRAFNHVLGNCSVTIFGRKDIAARHRRSFPASLQGAPMLMPTENSVLRRALDQWFDEANIHPRTIAEFDDPALMKAFGQDGRELFPAPSILEVDIKKQYGMSVVGRISQVREQFYAISVERRIRHPAVIAICQNARTELFRD